MAGFLADWQIEQNGIITPFVDKQVRYVNHPVISYGNSSYGYDLRLSPKDFRIFRHIPGQVVDPKDFNPDNLEPAVLRSDFKGDFFVLPGHSYGLGVSVEHIRMPQNLTAICLGKSTYARCGIIANMTPVEAGWEGYLTLEFSNSSPTDTKIYANEGCVQVLFVRGEACQTTYADRAGKYQDQGPEVTRAKV